MITAVAISLFAETVLHGGQVPMLVNHKTLEKSALYKICDFRNYAFNGIPSLRIKNY